MTGARGITLPQAPYEPGPDDELARRLEDAIIKPHLSPLPPPMEGEEMPEIVATAFHSHYRGARRVWTPETEAIVGQLMRKWSMAKSRRRGGAASVPPLVHRTAEERRQRIVDLIAASETGTLTWRQMDEAMREFRGKMSDDVSILVNTDRIARVEKGVYALSYSERRKAPIP